MNASSTSEAIASQLLEQSQEPLVAMISLGLRQESPARKLTPAEVRRLEAQTDEAAQRIMIRLREEFPRRLNFGDLLAQVSFEIYDKHFTEADMKDLVAFYKTPTAQKFVRLTPQITADLLPKIEALIEPKLTRLMHELIADEQKKLITKRN